VSFGFADVLLFLLFGVMLLFFSHFQRITLKFDERLNDLNAPGGNMSFDLESLKEELMGIVENTIESLSPPTAFDHFAGMASQYFQMRMMKEFKIDQPTQLEEEIKEE